MVTFDLPETFESEFTVEQAFKIVQMGADEYYITYECRKCDNFWCRIVKERGCLQKCSKCNSYRAPCTEVSQYPS